MEVTFDKDFDFSALKDLEKSVRSINKRHIRFGWFDGKSYPSSHPNKGLPIAQIAHWQEYGLSRGTGSKDIPARPYFRQSINMIRYGYRNQIASIFLDVLQGNNTMNKLEKLSQEFVKDYSESVLRQNYQKLSAYTVQLKGHSYQMDDSGFMIMNFKAKVYRTSQASIKT